MAVNFTKAQAQEMRDDPDYKPRTETCPLCNPDVQVVGGISLYLTSARNVATCGNQPKC